MAVEFQIAPPRKIEEAEALTQKNRKLTLTFAFNYGGRAEIVDCARALAQRVRDGEIDPADIDEKAISRGCTHRICPTQTLSFGLQGNTAFELSLVGIGIFRVRLSRMCCGPIFGPNISANPSCCTNSATDASAGSKTSKIPARHERIFTAAICSEVSESLKPGIAPPPFSTQVMLSSA